MKIELGNVTKKVFRDKYFNLWRSSFGNKPKCCDAWYEWLNYYCPTGINNSFVIKENNDFISGYGLLPITLNYNRQEHESTLCTNVMTHPEHGGKGLFTKIGAHALQTMKSLGKTIQVGIPNDNAIRGHMKVGWQRMPNLYFYQKTNFDTKYSKNNIGYKVIEKFDETHDEWIARFHEKYNLYVKKDHKFLNWRYANHPLNSYTCIVLDNGETSVNGYVIIKSFTENNKTKIHIVDYAYLYESDLTRLLLAVDHYTNGKADLVNLWRFEDSNEIQFANAGYTKTENYDRLILFSDIKFDNNTSNWHIVLGDNDVY